MSEGKQKLQKWLNKYFKVVLADGRILIGLFLCTDGNSNIILGMSNFANKKLLMQQFSIMYVNLF